MRYLYQLLNIWNVRQRLGQVITVRAGLVLVLLVGALFRFTGLQWDSGRNLHPDERFLTSVTSDLSWPTSLEAYFDPQASSLSPYSLPNMGLFAYGALPVVVVKWVAIQLDRNTYDLIPLVGRTLSGLFDLGAAGLLFLIGRRLYGAKTGLLAAGLLALSVLNIQLSHFYTVDTFSNLFVVATFFFLLRVGSGGRWIDYALTGLMFGLGLASKISILTLALPVVLASGLDFLRRRRSGLPMSAVVEQSLVRVLTVAAVTALTFRLVQPFAFTGPTFLNWSLNPQWIEDINEQARIVAGNSDLPWLQQWTGRSPTFALYNLVVWGLGLPLGLAALAGLGLATYELVHQRKLEHLLPVIFVTSTFAYHAATFVKFMRYFLPLYPFLALLAAYLIVRVWELAFSREVFPQAASAPAWLTVRLKNALRQERTRQALALGLASLVIGGAVLYALAFSAIYTRPHTRVKASRWMYAHLPPGATLANEHWDDWLPIGGLDGKHAYGDSGLFQAVELEHYQPDTPEKLERLVANLSKADYLVLSSNRLYDSIRRLPARYPMTTRYYQLLFSGELGFERIAEFTSYPTFLGLQFPDQLAEESFHVYDHPRVQIFRKTAAYDPETVRHLLSAGVDWEAVLQLTPRQASAAPTGLRLTPAEQSQYREAAERSSVGVNEASWGSRMPVLAWALVLLLIGLLAAPLTLLTFAGFADRGYLFSKGAGLLLAAWGAWLISSTRLAPFTAWTLLAVLVLLALASSCVLRTYWQELAAFVRARWRLLLLEEGLFWGFFALGLFLRWSNPDLWHPSLGGEKPMDLAYLTAVIRTPYFPPYDPWFSGGYINYYYFGFVLVGALTHLTGIVPAIAYNLAVPTFFAMTALGGFGVAYNLAESWRGRSTEGRFWPGMEARPFLAGISGALFVAVLGNLGQVKLLFDNLRRLSMIEYEGGAPLLVMLAQFGDGVVQWFNGQKLDLRTEWWYWNATRLIPAGEGEAGPINEMPFFTFLYGDLHAHLMALPFTLLVLALAIILLRAPAHTCGAGASPGGACRGVEGLTLGLLGLALGALWVMNTWDFPTFTLLAAAALALRAAAQRGQIDAAAIWATGWRVALILLGAWLFFFPYHQHYATTYFSAELWQGARTPLWAYLLIHGFFLFVIGSYLLVELLHGRGHNPLARSLRLALRRGKRLRRLRRLFTRLVRPTREYRLALILSLGALLGWLVVLLANRTAALALGLVLLTGLLLASQPAPRRQFVLTLIGLGLGLTLLVEFVVIKGDVSRMNTVFRFYLQVWVLFATASAVVLPQLVVRLRAASAARRKLFGGWEPRDWWVTFGLLLFAAALYPLTALPARLSDRFEGVRVNTLDGRAYMRTAVYSDQEQSFALDWDRQGTEWLRQHAKGLPVIVEANTPLYRWGGRVSIYTGFPSIIGWDWHQKQQRSILPEQMIDQRIEDVAAIYSGEDLEQTRRLLERYGVEYIYVGPLERIYYPGPGLEKFVQYQGQLWDVVYQNEQVQIYAVREQAIGSKQ